MPRRVQDELIYLLHALIAAVAVFVAAVGGAAVAAVSKIQAGYNVREPRFEPV